MNLQELIKEHNLKAGDEVVLTQNKGFERYYTLGIHILRKARLHSGLVITDCEWTANNTCDFGLLKQKQKPTPTPHIHRELIKAWANGAVIQYWNTTHECWKLIVGNPTWTTPNKYRVKPDNTEEIAQLEDQISDLQARVVELRG